MLSLHRQILIFASKLNNTGEGRLTSTIYRNPPVLPADLSLPAAG